MILYWRKLRKWSVLAVHNPIKTAEIENTILSQIYVFFPL